MSVHQQPCPQLGRAGQSWSKNVSTFNRDRDDGFSLIEIAICLMFMCVLGGIAVLNMNGIMPGLKANKAMYQTIAQLRRGRELAISQRRLIELQFNSTNQIQLLRIEEPAHTKTLIATATLDGHCEFRKFSSIGSDTPDGFGNSSAIDFGSADKLIFSTEGTLIDESGDPVSGTVFLGIDQHPEAARAVTVLGSTGRIKSYRWAGDKWIP